MNYYIIPKNNFNIKIKLDINPKPIDPFISYSLIYYLNDIYIQLLNIDEFKVINNNESAISFINKIVNPFEFIHTNVPGACISVSKVKPESNIFFELMEIFQVCSITDILSLKKKITIAHLTSNNSSTIELLNMLREDNDDNIIDIEFDYDKIHDTFIKNMTPTPTATTTTTATTATKVELFIFEFKECDYTHINQYIKNMILVLFIIVNNQASSGTSIIKIDNIFYKSIVDILFIFSAIFEKVFLIKPTISKITKGERFIICKNLNLDVITQTKLLQQLDTHLKQMLIDDTFLDKNIHSIIENNIPYYFSNKIEESNAVIGQQQLEAYDQIINILKNKNRDEKIEILKRNNIQKCIQWCEKNQLPHNKFIDRVNIFLSAKKCDEKEKEKEKENEKEKEKEKENENQVEI